MLGPEWIGAARQSGPLIVCGDFNSPAGRVVHGLMTEHLRDTQVASPSGPRRNTFATLLPILCIDYIFVTEHFEISSCEVPRTPLTKVASDHYPLIADLALPVRDGGR